MTQHDVIVVGGGFAGVTTARELARAGLDVALVEARDRLGGRTWFKAGALADTDLEMGGQYIHPCQHKLWNEIQRYDILVTEAELPTRFTWLQNGERRDSPLPAPFEDIAGVERLISLCSSAAARIDPQQPLADQLVSDLDVPLADFAAAAQLGPYARDLAAAFFGLFTSADWRDASALHFLLWLRSSGGTMWEFLRASLLGPTFARGTKSLIDAIITEAPVNVSLSWPVEQITQHDAGVVVSSAATEITAKYVVLAIPLNVLATVTFQPQLSVAKIGLSRLGHAGKGSKVWAVVEGMPDDFFGLGHDNVLHFVGAHGRTERGVLACAFGPDAHAIDPDDPKDVERHFRKYLPGCTVVASHGHNWVDDPYARGTWTAFRPGQAQPASALAKPDRRLIFAGTETALQWPGYIDGAIESGARAAGTAAELLGMPAVAARQS